MFDKPILFYSEYCIHSTNFLNTLMKTPEFYNNFVRINIDADISTKRRPDIFYNIQRELNIKIVEVPTIITPGPEYVLTGADAFSWLEKEYQSNKAKDDIKGFNFIEMGIPVGSELYFNTDGEIATVISEKLVRFRGTETSLTNATRMANRIVANPAANTFRSCSRTLASKMLVGSVTRTTPRTCAPEKTGTATYTNSPPIELESLVPEVGLPSRAALTSGRDA